MKKVREAYKIAKEEIDNFTDYEELYKLIQDRVAECDTKLKSYHRQSDVIGYISIPLLLPIVLYTPVVVWILVIYLMAYRLVYNDRRIKELGRIMQHYVTLAQIGFARLSHEKLTKLEEQQ